ncbi:YybH family protein [Candidatus Halocynthiibacter alkanivorans]|uniref:YybH family protein n=1 Tax=Candidatus Halocynthiibacter alkanivorans TaxID=2267619 RepID=UPI00109C4FC8|nr:nuclear transport factor 2 family protein [Candidatus Halocynthiibacter alkanivorans]
MSVTIKSAIEARNADMMVAFKTQDLKTLGEMYTIDGKFMLPHAPVAEGQDAVSGTFGAMIDAGLKELRLASQSVKDFGDYAVELGAYSLHVDGGTQVDKGHYQVLWQLQNDTWLISQDIVTSSEPQ